MFQELSKNFRKYCNLQRKTVLNSVLPKMRKLGSYTYCHLDEEKFALTELAHSQIMPLSDCKLMTATLKKPSQRFNVIQIGKQTLSGNMWKRCLIKLFSASFGKPSWWGS